MALPALPVQFLWINMMTAMFLGLMLVFEPKEHDLMQRPPRDPKEPILTFPLFMRTGFVTLILLAGASVSSSGSRRAGPRSPKHARSWST